MYVEKITKKSKACNHIKKLYKTAFPKEERIPLFFLLGRGLKNGGKMSALFNDEKDCVGLSYTVERNEMVYLFFFAIDKNLRDSGYGSEYLSLLHNKYKQKQIVLLIEEIHKSYKDNKTRLKRKHFYLKNNFHDTGVTVQEGPCAFDIYTSKLPFNFHTYKDLIKKFSGSFINFYLSDLKKSHVVPRKK